MSEPRYGDRTYLYGEPVSNENSALTIWSRPIKARLSQSTLTPGQAAKRDLSVYHDLLDDALPAIPERVANLIVCLFRYQRNPNTVDPLDDQLWNHLVDSLPDTNQGRGDWKLVGCLRNRAPIERMALIDAADRCIKYLADHPEVHMPDPDILAEFFRLTPKES